MWVFPKKHYPRLTKHMVILLATYFFYIFLRNILERFLFIIELWYLKNIPKILIKKIFTMLIVSTFHDILIT